MSWLIRYKKISSPVKVMVLLEFFLQLINTAYFMVFNFYLNDLGFDDSFIAQLLSYRFIATMLLALPLGLFVKKRRIVPIFRFATICIPLASFLVLYSSAAHKTSLMTLGIFLMGIGTTIAQSLMIPFIMRNEAKETRMQAIALHFTTWSITTFLLGMFCYASRYLLGSAPSEESILLGVTGLALVGSVIALFPIKEIIPTGKLVSSGFNDYDWNKIGQILLPAFIIGVGAGLTIPFINLFFLHSFSMSTEDFLLMGSISTIFVTFGSMYGPRLAERFGNITSIVCSQTIAVTALVVMAFSSFFTNSPIALVVACLCYLIRQPLMNLANPILSGFTMSYVGPKNQELASALQQSLWAGSWYFSSQLFAWMRSEGLPFASVLLTTAMIYSLGVFCYFLLLRRDSRRPSVVAF